MQPNEFFETKMQELTRERTIPLDTLCYAQYKKLTYISTHNETGQCRYTLETSYPGILKPLEEGIYFDFISDQEVNEEEIEIKRFFQTNIMVNKQDIMMVFSDMEKEYNLYAFERITSGNYGGSIKTYTWRASKGKRKTLEEYHEKRKFAEEILEQAREETFFGRLLYKKKMND